MSKNSRISKWEKSDALAIAKINRDKKIAELESHILELKKSPMIKSSMSMQQILKNKLLELGVLKGG